MTATTTKPARDTAPAKAVTHLEARRDRGRKLGREIGMLAVNVYERGIADVVAFEKDAAKITPVVAIVVSIGYSLNEPRRTRNSPTKPLVPGSPMLLRETKVSTAANSGTTRAIPPYASIILVWRRS